MNSTIRIIGLYLKIWFVLFILTALLYGQSSNTNNFPNKACWQYPLNNPSKQQIASDNKESIYLIRDNKYIDSINNPNGKINWTFDSGGTIVARILVNSEFIYMVNIVRKSGSEEDILTLRSISKYSGLTFWKTDIKFNADSKNQVTPENTYIYETKDGLLLNSSFCFIHINKLDGSLKWKKCITSESADSIIMSDILDGNVAFFDSTHIYIIVLTTGEVLSKIPVETQVTAIDLFNKSIVVFGDKKGSIRSLNVENGKTIWTVKSGGEISSIVKTEKGLLVTSFDNFIYMLDKSSGRKIWKRRFANRIKEKPFIKGNINGNKENIAVIVSGDKNAFFIDTSNGKIISQISLATESFFLSPSIFVNGYYFFLTNKGIEVFTDGICSKNEADWFLKTNPLFTRKCDTG